MHRHCIADGGMTKVALLALFRRSRNKTDLNSLSRNLAVVAYDIRRDPAALNSFRQTYFATSIRIAGFGLLPLPQDIPQCPFDVFKEFGCVSWNHGRAWFVGILVRALIVARLVRVRSRSVEDNETIPSEFRAISSMHQLCCRRSSYRSFFAFLLFIWCTSTCCVVGRPTAAAAAPHSPRIPTVVRMP